MAVTLIFDTVDGDSIVDVALSSGISTQRIVRSGIALGVDGGLPYQAMLQALAAAGFPTLYSPHPDASVRGDVLLRRQVVTPMRSDNAVRFHLIYQTPDRVGGGDAGTYWVEDEPSITQEPVEVDPNGAPIQAILKQTVGGADKIFRFTGAVPQYTPIRTLSVTGWTLTQPTDAALKADGAVNDAPWQGLDIGFWLCAGVKVGSHVIQSQIANIGNFPAAYEITARFITRVKRNWMEFLFYRDAAGRIPRNTNLQADVIALRSQPYQYTQIQRDSGVSMVGNYPLIDYPTTFGF